MPELQLLRADHARALLEFELDNRAYFAAWITDRGDDFFEHFEERLETRLAEQQAGAGAYYVLVEHDGTVVGRFNLIFTDEGSAELGYRVAERVAGRGLATTAVRELCELAAEKYGVRRLVAATSVENVASQRVLSKAQFVMVGPADLGGRSGYRYQRLLRDT